MTVQRGDWTGKWAAERIEPDAVVESVEILTDNQLLIHRNNGAGVVTVTTVGGPCLTEQKVAHVLAADPKPMFIVNLTPESYVPEDAYTLLRRQGIPVGTLNDLKESLKLPDPGAYVNRNVEFRERGLSGHKAVADFERLADQLYAVTLRGSKVTIRVAMIHAYEVTADHVHSARDRYGRFAVAVKTHPYGRITESAETAVANFGAKVFDWRGFLGWLHRA